VTACGVEHVYLSYNYLECNDIDGYVSLLDNDVVLDRPDTPPGRGRDEVVHMLLDRSIPPARHSIEQVLAHGDRVVVIGSLSQEPGLFTPAVDRAAFVDVFTLSETAMLRGCRRYFFAPPT
jgi:ketosteroid isomerase-like protein